MQATTHRFDETTGDGSVITDAGLVIPFGPEAFALSGLRHVRSGQRVGVVLSEDGRRVVEFWIPGVGAVPGHTPRP